jgi:hypothetical protein
MPANVHAQRCPSIMVGLSIMLVQAPQRGRNKVFDVVT